MNRNLPLNVNDFISNESFELLCSNQKTFLKTMKKYNFKKGSNFLIYFNDLFFQYAKRLFWDFRNTDINEKPLNYVAENLISNSDAFIERSKFSFFLMLLDNKKYSSIINMNNDFIGNITVYKEIISNYKIKDARVRKSLLSKIAIHSVYDHEKNKWRDWTLNGAHPNINNYLKQITLLNDNPLNKKSEQTSFNIFLRSELINNHEFLNDPSYWPNVLKLLTERVSATKKEEQNLIPQNIEYKMVNKLLENKVILNQSTLYKMKPRLSEQLFDLIFKKNELNILNIKINSDKIKNKNIRI